MTSSGLVCCDTVLSAHGLLQGNDCTVPTSVVFADELKDLKLDDEDMFVSHDVVFTNTPIPQSIEIIKNRLQKDKSLKKRTLLTPDDIVELLNFVLTTTYFVFRGQMYQQKFGTAMV